MPYITSVYLKNIYLLRLHIRFFKKYIFIYFLIKIFVNFAFFFFLKTAYFFYWNYFLLLCVFSLNWRVFSQLYSREMMAYFEQALSDPSPLNKDGTYG